MRETYGDMWAYDKRENFIICVTTNGFIKLNGEGVMGAGCAKEAADRYPDLPRLLGQSLKLRGNVVSLLTNQILSFPVKHKWDEKADPRLIQRSAENLTARATAHPFLKYILPRPGCGNGKLLWVDVKPLLVSLPDNVFVIGAWKERPVGRKQD